MMVRLENGVASRIDLVAGRRRRSEFIREAVERELKRRERLSKSAPPATD